MKKVSVIQKTSSFQTCLNQISYYFAEEAAALDTRLGTAERETCFTYTEDQHEENFLAKDNLDLEQFFYGNVLYGLSLEDLYQMEDEGITLADLLTWCLLPCL